MNRLLDKIAILMICLAGFCLSDEPSAPVIALLISVSASCSVQLLTGRTAAAVLIALCSALCGFVPLVFCALPLMLYDALWERKWWLTLPALAVLTNTNGLQPLQLLVAAGGTAAAIIIFLRISKLEESVGSLTALRDEVTVLACTHHVSLGFEVTVGLAALRETQAVLDDCGIENTRVLVRGGSIVVENAGPADELLPQLVESLIGKAFAVAVDVVIAEDN